MHRATGLVPGESEPIVPYRWGDRPQPAGGDPVLPREGLGEFRRVVDERLSLVEGDPLEPAYGPAISPGVDPVEQRVGGSLRGLDVVRDQLEPVHDPHDGGRTPAATVEAEAAEAERVADDEVRIRPDAAAGDLGEAGALDGGAGASEGHFHDDRGDALRGIGTPGAGRMQHTDLVSAGRETGRECPRGGSGVVGISGTRTDGHKVDAASRHDPDSSGRPEKGYVRVAG
jgi:hypothetical protein